MRYAFVLGLACLWLGMSTAESEEESRGALLSVDSTPYRVQTSHLTLPPFLEERVIYHHAFATAEPDLNTAGATQVQPPTIVANGFAGTGCFMNSPTGGEIICRAFSPHRPLTLSFWWAIEEPLEQNGGISLFALRNTGRGYISNFVRGGPWCALEDSAFCFQLYNLPGIKNVHSNFDRQFRQHYPQSPTAWHHTVMTVTLGTRIALFVDGQRVSLYQLSGRALRETDALSRLSFGSYNTKGLFVDEVTILDLALSDEQAAQWHTIVRSLEQTGHLRTGVVME